MGEFFWREQGGGVRERDGWMEGWRKRSGGGGERVDAAHGVTTIRIEMVHVAMLRHQPHTLSGAGSTHSVSVCVFQYYTWSAI